MKTTDKKTRFNWRPFEEARVFVHSLKIKSKNEWSTWAKSNERPNNIPANPVGAYKSKGWTSWGDWLGTNNIATFDRVYLSFDEARLFAQSLNLQKKEEWEVWAKSSARPSNIPASPRSAYKDWASWGDWLGTKKNRRGGHRPFKEARAFIQSLGLKNIVEWKIWAGSESRPSDIPAAPRQAYRNSGWISWGDWLGTKNRKGGYRSYEEACDFVCRIGLQTVDEWRIWAKSNARPADIPANPYAIYKNKGWVSMGEWLGTGRLSPKNRKYRPFEEARNFVHSLDLQSQKSWNQWSKSGNRPDDIPVAPTKIYKEWKSWGDWLGTRNRRGGYRSFTDAREFVRKLNLTGKSHWRIWSKSKDRPTEIPANPTSVYKNKGWIDWSDWLGTGYVKPDYLSFEEARAFVRTLGITTWKGWSNWAKSNKRPTNIPASPHIVYKTRGWVDMGDWLGTGYKKTDYRPFDVACEFVHNVGLRNVDEWRIWAKSDARPADIPSNPYEVYNHKGWTSWGDWLGTGIRRKGYRHFEEARSFTRNLRLENVADWNSWAKTNGRPKDIPAFPDAVYKSKGWMGWGNWLGIFNLWNKKAVLSFLTSIKPVLRYLQPAELYAIMRQNGLVAAIQTANTNALLIKSIRDLCSSPNPEADFETLIAEIERENQLVEEGVEEELSVEADFVETADENLPALRSMQALKAVDELVQAGITSDEETIEFLVSNRVSGLWQETLNNSGAVSLESLRGETGGVYFQTIRERFFSQYDGAQSLAIPAGYDFRVKGELTAPNLMQKLAAYRILTEKRLGNWSGVGAGKTLSAILASRVIDARLTVIVAFNSTVEPWAKRVKEAFPDSAILVKERGYISVDPHKHTYLILNFETFQQPDSAAMVERLVEKHKIDFVVLDEIQSVKQRTPKMTSKRRQVVSGLLTSASEKNPDLCVLGMSATPVINNLYEAKALLEMVKGVSFDELETFSNIPNAIAMHEKLILYGIRYRPEYRQTVETEVVEIKGDNYLSQLVKVRKGAILDMERVLLDAKLETILASLKKGTLIYTHYLTGLVTPLKHAIENAGFKVGLFTGDDKTGLDAFKKGKVDVLIGSVPVGTGVDGLQYVCNRMIIVSLPWTSAEYEQLIGRLYRQGSKFDMVEVIVPQVVLEHNGDVWSWDRMRMHRIQYKKTLADAAMDGVIPEGELSSPETLYKKAREALQAWIRRIEEDGVAIIERAQLKVPLPKETAHIIQRRFGDLSVMNSRFNTAYSSTTHDRLKENPEEWYLYHTLYREARKDWAEIPFERIARSLKKRPDWVVGDFGCGEAKLASLLPNKVYSFDHIAINENVTACDMSHIPVEDGMLDVAVFSLSLMGLNYADYLKEASRTLKFSGMLKIAEPAGRWEGKRQELLSVISEAGFSLVGNVEESNHFLYIDGIKIDV